MIERIRNFQYYALVGVLFFTLGLITNAYLIVPKISATKYEMSFIANKDNKTVKLDSVAILKLENAIAQVEKKNDGRFEVLTWSSVLVLSIIAILLTINFFISERNVKHIINEKHEDIIRNIEHQRNELNLLIEDTENMRTSIETLHNNQF